MDVAESDTPAFVKKLLDSPEFKKTVNRMIEDAIESINITSDQVTDFSDEVESVINHGTFETTFSA